MNSWNQLKLVNSIKLMPTYSTGTSPISKRFMHIMPKLSIPPCQIRFKTGKLSSLFLRVLRKDTYGFGLRNLTRERLRGVRNLLQSMEDGVMHTQRNSNKKLILGNKWYSWMSSVSVGYHMCNSIKCVTERGVIPGKVPNH